MNGPAVRTFPAACLVAFLLAAQTAAGQCEVVKLVSDPNDEFGGSVDIDGDHLVVGAFRDDEAGFNKGAAFVYRRDDHGTPHDPSDDLWSLEDKLLPTALSNWYPRSVTIDGDRILVGMLGLPGLDHYAEVWRRDDGGTPGVFEDDAWLLDGKLPAPFAPLGDYFGQDAGLSGDWALVGDPDDDHYANSSGAVSVFRRDDAGTPDPADDSWIYVKELYGSKHQYFGLFGTSVDFQGQRALIGAYGENFPSGFEQGAAYVFERDDHETADPVDDTWVERARLVANDGFTGDRFGWSVSLDGDVALIGAPNDDEFGPDAGAAYVFRLQGDSWVQVAKLHAPGDATAKWTGVSVALRGTTAAVGSEAIPGQGFVGQAFLFRGGPGDLWLPAGAVEAVSAVSEYMRLATDGTNLLIGSPADTSVSTEGGCAHVVALLKPPWTWQDGEVAGAAGAPFLFGAGPLQIGSAFTISVHHGAPSTPGFVVLGLTALNLPFKGGVLVPQPDRIYPVVLDAAGGLAATATWPHGVPAAPPMLLQAWMLDATAPAGYSATNGLLVAP